ncbi:MAG: tetratricopeptide repeat protein [Desulfobacterales bacterium]|nr:tetratricopeptide repeat protein [Desulfobacterales bacterium]
MTRKGYKRKLTAILSADVEGYSRLMGEDEEATVRTLTAYREVFAELTRQHDGRVIDSPGDNLLIEFASVVDAAQCAVAVQKEIRTRNDALPGNRKMQFRIGINLGDVIQEDERIYGDGVNIAARLEALADPGGICIAKTAFDHIETKLPVGYEYLGEQTVKNISRPVGAYRVVMAPQGNDRVQRGRIERAKGPSFLLRKCTLGLAIGVLLLVAGLTAHRFYLKPLQDAADAGKKEVYALPDKPSIAVLPLNNISGDPDQAYFSDGLTEDIITALSKVSNMSVIARNSAFAYKGRSVRIKQIAEELGVRYVLEGGVQKAGEQIRITAQLVEAFTGRLLWAERYDRSLTDIFSLQDEITKEIITALQVKLTMGEDARLLGKGTQSLEAYLKTIKARELIAGGTREGNALARKLAGEAIALDPSYSEACRILGVTHFEDVVDGERRSGNASLPLAEKYIQKAISLDESNGVAYAKLGFIHMMMRQYDRAMEEGKTALELEPNSAYVLHAYGAILYFAGHHEAAIPFFERAMGLNPKPPVYYRHQYGAALREANRYEEAIAQAEKAIRQKPDDIASHSVLVSSYSLAGRIEKAREAAARILKIDPGFSPGEYIRRTPHRNQTVKDRYLKAMRKAGLV